MPVLKGLEEGGHIYRAPLGKQLKLLGWRNKIMLKREPQAVQAKIGNTIFFAILILSLYWDVGAYNAVDMKNLAGAVFFWLVGQLMNNYFNTILIFQNERAVFMREKANQLYGLFPYYLVKNIQELPFTIILPFVQLLLIYWGVGFSTDNLPYEFLQMLLAVFLLSHTALGMGYFISASFSSVQAATAVAPSLTLPVILFGGFFANSGSIIVWIRWLQYLSPLYYAQMAILQAQWSKGPVMG